LLAGYYPNEIENIALRVLHPKTLAILNEIEMTFPAEDLRDDICCEKFPIFWLSEYYKENMVCFASYFYEDDEFTAEERYGYLIAFWIGENITPETSLERLVANRKIKAMTWENRDHLDDFNLPSFAVQWVENYQKQPSDITVLAMMN
jgi:hypothetical protein